MDGFDYFYGITASLDIPPYVYIENDHVTATTIDTIEGTTGKGFWRRGPAGNDFRHEEVLDVLTGKTVDYIRKHSTSASPFFLYYAMPAPHTPILPTKEFLGKSGTNAYGDFVLMVDEAVGQITKAVREAGIENNTLIVTADVAEYSHGEQSEVAKQYLREFSLASDINVQTVDAQYELGVLTVTLHKKEQYLPKQIHIN